MRKSANSWVMRIFLFLLVLSFAVWGIGDLIRGTPDTTVAQVGKIKISTPEFNDQYRRALHQLQQRFGQSLTGEQAKQFGLPDQVLSQITGRALLDQEATAMGLLVTDQTVVATVHDDPTFHSPTGQFDRMQFEQRIRAEGLSEPGFIAMTRQNLQRGQLVDALGVGAAVVPDVMAKTLYTYRQEKRTAVLLTVPPEKTGPAPEPDAAALEKFHADHAADFTAPEYRALTFVTLTPADRVAGVKVTDQELQDEYDSRRTSFGEPEKRALLQIVYPDEAAANAAYEKIKAGADFAAVAKETRNLTPKDIDLGLVAKADLEGAGSAVGDTAFALAVGDVGKPVQSAFGWNLVKVTAIKPATLKSFDQVKDELREELALHKAGDEMYTLSNQLQDSLAGGSTIDEAAAKLQLKVHKVAAVDAKGLAPDGKPVADLPNLPNFLSTAFDATAGIDPQVEDAGDGQYFAIKVEGITPSALKPLDQVHGQVVAAWKAENRREAARKLATEMADKLKGGADFAALAKSIGESLHTTTAMTRAGAGADETISAPLLGDLFAAGPAGVVTAPAAKGGGTVVAQLAKIEPADPAKDTVGFDQLRKSLAAAEQNDLYGEYRKALEGEFAITVNRKNLEGAL